jgi:hypothetical protein
MATGRWPGDVIDETYNAGADLSGAQYLGMQITSDYTIKVPTAALANAFGGVLQDKPAAAGRAGRCVKVGCTKAYFGGTVTIGQKVACTKSGYFIAQTSGYAAVGNVEQVANSGYLGEVNLWGGMGNIAANSVVAGQI